MYASHKPAARPGVSLLVMALSLTPAAPVLAVQAATKPGATANKSNTARIKMQKPQLAKKADAAPAAVAGNTDAAKPEATVAVSQPTMPTAANTPIQVLPVAVAVASPQVAIATVAAPVAAVPAEAPAAVAAAPVPAAAVAVPAAYPVNPYLSGWYQPVPTAALPAMALRQLNYNARYVSDRVTSIPGKLSDALPSIKAVHPTGGRDLVVANLKCPVEMMAGQYMLPANAMRQGVNGLFGKLNETQLLKFDIQLVCS